MSSMVLLLTLVAGVVILGVVLVLLLTRLNKRP